MNIMSSSLPYASNIFDLSTKSKSCGSTNMQIHAKKKKEKKIKIKRTGTGPLIMTRQGKFRL